MGRSGRHDRGSGRAARAGVTRPRLLAALAVLLLLRLAPLAVASPAAPSASAHDVGTPPGQGCPTLLGCGSDVQAAIDLEQKISDNFWYGLTLPIDYNTPQRIPGDVKDIDPQWGDAGIWSGNYLAAESFRYALARHNLQGPAGQQGSGQQGSGQQGSGQQGSDGGTGREFWLDQEAQAKTRIDAMIAQVDLRTNITREWTGQLNPSVDTSQTPPGVSYGGAVVQGEPGMLMYSCAPADAPPGFGMPRDADVRGPWHWTNDLGRPARLTLPDGDYVCEAATTRDCYAGTLFGLLTAFDLVSADDPALRSVIRDDVLAIADYLLNHGWSWVRPDGNVTVPFGNEQDNFIDPLMVLSPTYRLGVTQAALHVAQAAGPATEATKWQAVWTEEMASQASAADAVANEVNDPSPTAGYYGWNLAHLMYYDLIRLAANPVEKATFRRDFSIVDRQTSDNVNAFFETVGYTITGEPARLDAAVTHLRQWLLYRAKIDQGGVTNNTARCGAEIACVPQDQYDIIMNTPAGSVSVTVPGSSTTLRAVQPLPIADRPPEDFLWQHSPFTDMDGSVSATHQEPGIDYLLPYWMLRYYTEVAPPPLDPLTVWPGPKYSGS